ncbi:MAG TPA: alpha/beta hydrolase [Acidimicrobiia bacterium]|nr:alpha/beta hydrolase [Acidimicrobiia bacterium]
MVLSAVMLGAVSVSACSSGTNDTSSSATTNSTTPPTTAPCRSAAAAQTHRYASYEGVDPNLTSLDLYLPAVTEPCQARPLVVWVHGGSWGGGDKKDFIADKVTLFNGAGYAFASVNYRLTDADVPNPWRWPVHDQDGADAVAWLVHHASEFGIDRARVAVLGHSAGGGIVAAISADARYLGHMQLPLDAITCAGSMDGEGYDVVAGNTTSPPEYRPIYADAFGTDPAVWAEASPIRYVAANKGIPHYFVAARGPEWRMQQHRAWIDALKKAGVPVTVLDAQQLEHSDLAVDVGAPGDTIVTPALMSFLQGCFAK